MWNRNEGEPCIMYITVVQRRLNKSMDKVFKIKKDKTDFTLDESWLV